MLLAPRFKQGGLRPAPYFPHSASSRGSLCASTWLTKKRGQELALKWVICLSQVTCPFIQHLLSAYHEGAPAEAGLPKARDSSSNSSPSRGEKSHVAIERRDTLHSEKEAKQRSTPNNSPRKSLGSGQSIKYLGNKDTFLAVRHKRRVRLRRLSCLSKTAYVLHPSVHPKQPKTQQPTVPGHVSIKPCIFSSCWLKR